MSNFLSRSASRAAAIGGQPSQPIWCSHLWCPLWNFFFFFFSLIKKKITVNDTATSSEGELAHFPLSAKRLPKGRASLKTPGCELCTARVRNSSAGLGPMAGRAGVFQEPRPNLDCVPPLFQTEGWHLAAVPTLCFLHGHKSPAFAPVRPRCLDSHGQ